jgi:hypothetical protein
VGEEELTEADKKLFDFLRAGDFESKPWSTPDAAKALGLGEKQIYESLSNLSKVMKGRIYIYYKDGALRIQAE